MMVTDLKRLGQVAAVVAVMMGLAGCGIRPTELNPPSPDGASFPAQYPAP